MLRYNTYISQKNKHFYFSPHCVTAGSSRLLMAAGFKVQNFEFEPPTSAHDLTAARHINIFCHHSSYQLVDIRGRTYVASQIRKRAACFTEIPHFSTFGGKYASTEAQQTHQSEKEGQGSGSVYFRALTRRPRGRVCDKELHFKTAAAPRNFQL